MKTILKKISVFLLSLMLILSVVACETKNEPESGADQSTETSESGSMEEESVEGEQKENSEKDGQEKENGQQGGEISIDQLDKSLTPGSYEAEVEGYGGKFTVKVECTESKIELITVDDHKETEGVGGAAIEKLPGRIVEHQSLALDGLAGATKTSDALFLGVEDCIKQAGGSVEAWKTPAEKSGEQETVEKEVDVVVVGAGGAGLTAANALLEAGVENVLLLEKQGAFAGASAIAGGLAGGTSELQKSFGLTEDSPETIFMDLMRGGKFANDARLVWLWANEMGPTLDWLIQDMGAPIESQFSNFPEHTVQRTFYVTGGSGAMLQVLADKFESKGGAIMMETRAKELITDGNAVVGVVAENADGNMVKIKAKKVILATGGYGNNTDLLTEAVDNVLFYGASSSTGDGLLMCEPLNASLINMDYVKTYPQGIEVEPGKGRVSTVHSMLTTQSTGAIYVNKEGQRVVNENLDFVSIKDATKEQTDKIIFLVMDQAAYDKWSVLAHGDESSSPAGRFTFEEQEAWFNAEGGVPIFSRGDDIQKVAAKAGIDGKALEETINNWNKMVENGEDTDFGREELFSLDTNGKFYIIEQKLRFATSLGGLEINDQFQVLTKDGEVIPGLYAAGEVVGGAHGYESMPGCMLSWAVTSGRLAGASAAKDR